MAPPQIVAIRPLKYPDRIGIWKGWFLSNTPTWQRMRFWMGKKRPANKSTHYLASGRNLGVHFAICRVIPWWVCSARDDAPFVFGLHHPSSFFPGNKGSWDKLWSCLTDKAEIKVDAGAIFNIEHKMILLFHHRQICVYSFSRIKTYWIFYYWCFSQ